MKTSHTPTPWQVGNFDEYRILSCEENGPVGIATCNRKSDAAFIVTAVNCHAELLAALQDAEFLLRKIGKNPLEAGSMVNSCKRSAEDARAAIAKATK